VKEPKQGLARKPKKKMGVEIRGEGNTSLFNGEGKRTAIRVKRRVKKKKEGSHTTTEGKFSGDEKNDARERYESVRKSSKLKKARHW